MRGQGIGPGDTQAVHSNHGMSPQFWGLRLPSSIFSHYLRITEGLLGLSDA